MSIDFNDLCYRADRAFFHSGSGWCWFDCGDSILAYNPATRTEQRFEGPLASEVRTCLKDGTHGKLLETISGFDIPYTEEMLRVLKEGRVQQASESLGFLSLEQPNQLWIEVQGSCNEKCIHCYANSAPADLPSLDFETVRSILTDASERDIDFVQFTGGDPLLWPRLPEAVERARDLGLTPEIYTNGLKLTDELYGELVDSKPRFAFSVYSHDSETHNSITQVPGSWDRTRRAIERAVEGPTAVRAGIIVMANNQGQEKETVEYVRDLGVPEENIKISYVQNVGRGLDVGGADTRYEISREDTGNGSSEETAMRSEHGIGGKASFNGGKLCVSYTGDVIPCIFQRWVRMGNVHERSFREIMEEPAVEMVESPDAGDDDEKPMLACGDCRFHYTLLRWKLSRN